LKILLFWEKYFIKMKKPFSFIAKEPGMPASPDRTSME